MKKPDLTVLNSWYQYAVESSRKTHWDYFVIDQFLKGNHNIRGNPNDNSIEFRRSAESINFPINKVYSTFRAVRSFVTRHHPMITVEPENSSDEAKAYARRSRKTLERDNQLNQFQLINKEWVYYGIKYGVGYRQIGYDREKKCAIRWTVDPMDLLVGSKGGQFQDAPYIIKTIVRTIGYLKAKYPKADNIAPDNELAADEYKKLAYQINYNQTSTSPSINMDEQTAIVKECWYRVFKPNAAGGLINKCTFVDNQILDTAETPFTEYPFVPYYAEITPNESVSEGHLKHVIPPQRMLNLLETQLLEYNHIVNRGRFLKDKNAGFRVINTREGQIIEKNPGRSVQVLNPPSINPMLTEQIKHVIEFIEDLGGQHSASLGATPARVSSGDAIQALQQGDSNNIFDLRDNFEIALAQEAAWILKMYSLFERDGFVVEDKVDEETTDRFAVIGAKARAKLPERYLMQDNGGYCDVCAILPEHQIKVSVTSQLGETRGARLDLLLRLTEAGVIPGKVLLQHLEFPNTSDILERIAEEAGADILREQMTFQGQAQAQAQAQAQNLPMEEALAEAAPPPVEGLPDATGY